MLRNYNLIKDNFNQKYLSYRLAFYWQQVRELLYRHRLFAIFFILITSSSLDSAKYLGYPVAALVVDSANIYSKLISLAVLLLITFTIAKSQAEAIKGGAFRYYLDCLRAETNFSKLTDLLLNIIALSFVAILFILASIYCGQWFDLDAQKIIGAKFVVAWFAVIALQTNIIINNKIKICGAVLLLILLAFARLPNIGEYYVVTIVFAGSMWLILASDLNSKYTQGNLISNTTTALTTKVIKLVPFLTPQIACMRDNPNKFVAAYSGSGLIALLMIKLKIMGAKEAAITFLFVIHNFILNLLFITLAKNEIKYRILYSSFSYKLRNFKAGDLLFVAFFYALTCAPLYLANCINGLSIFAGIALLISSRYFLCYYRNAVSFILVSAVFFNLVAVSL